jgi:superfamily I DNA and/or RNA helicase
MSADVNSGEGLFHQPKRMNVALTRAENLLVVVGNPNIMKDDITWKEWLEFCRANGLWYGETGG